MNRTTRTTTRHTVLLALFAGLAFAQTMFYFVYLRDDPGNYNSPGAQGDQVAYVSLAQQIAQGTWDGAVHYMPGLPLVIALGQGVFGDPRLGIAVIQGLLYAAVVLGAARLAAVVFGAGTSLWSAAAVALNPALGYYAAQALTEFLTAAVLLALVAAVVWWARRPAWPRIVLIGVLIAAAGYLRSEYLGLTLVFALILAFLTRSLKPALVLTVVVAAALAPWVLRYAVVTGQPAIYNESPFSNLVLMGTWFRVFDEQTFAQLQQIETAPGSREQAIERASAVGPRPELSRRYVEQARGPYDRPLGETLALAADNVRLNFRQYAINHFVLAPVLIWAGQTPVRAADAPNLPSTARYAIWGAELALLGLALWQALLALRDRSTLAASLSFLGVVLFLTAVHILIAVDSRFTTPALPLVGLFAGVRIAQLLRLRQPLAVRYAA